MKTLASSTYEIETALMDTDLVIGPVLVHGAKAPVSRGRPQTVAQQCQLKLMELDDAGDTHNQAIDREWVERARLEPTDQERD